MKQILLFIEGNATASYVKHNMDGPFGGGILSRIE